MIDHNKRRKQIIDRVVFVFCIALGFFVAGLLVGHEQAKEKVSHVAP